MLIYVGIPCLDGRPYAALVDSLLAEQLRGIKDGVHLLVDWEVGCSLIGAARNNLAKRFLATKEADCIVYVDSDLSWPAGELTKLAQSPFDVIGATYRGKTDTERYHVHGPIERDGKLYRVGGLPGGFIKISRVAFSVMKANQYGDHNGGAIRDYFPTGWHDGQFYGEDYGFCRLWREAGGTVWLDPSITLRHHDGGRWFTGNPTDWLKAFHG